MTIALIIDYIVNQMDVLTVLNTVALLALIVGCFKEKFTIIDLETWNTVAEFYNAHAEEFNEEGEAAGGCGFFREALNNEEEEEDDDE